MDIANVYKEFKGLKNYYEKLKFFDQHFTLLPFSFPSFDVHLNFLLKENGIKSLTEIFEKERQKRPGFIELVFYSEMKFVFDAHPHNSNVHTFNDYIISKFTCNGNCFNDHLLEVAALSQTGRIILENLIIEVNSLIKIVKEKIENNKDRSFEKQFFNVFYSGFIDFNNGQVKKHYHKKKLIELYLYAMGNLFGMYKQALSEQVCKTEIKVRDISNASITYKEFKTRVLLLHEFGVTDYLRKKYKNSGEINIESKIIELYFTITGESVQLVENVVKDI